MAESPQINGNGSIKYIDFLVRILVPLMATIIGLLYSELGTIEKRLDASERTLAVIQGNRFTASDGLNLEARIRQSIPPFLNFERRLSAAEDCLIKIQLERECG